jgi:hypothetical protein
MRLRHIRLALSRQLLLRLLPRRLLLLRRPLYPQCRLLLRRRRPK